MPHDDRLTASAEEGVLRLSREIEAQLRALVHELRQAAAEDRQNAVRDARAVAEAEASRHLASELARTQADAANAQAAEVSRVRQELNELLANELARARSDAAQTLANETARLRGEAANETARLRAEAAANAADEVRRARSDAAVAHADEIRRMRAEAADHLASEVSNARSEERQAVLASVDRILSGMHHLDAAQSLSEILDALSDAVAQEAPRVGVLVVQAPGRVQSWRLSGFGPDMGEGRRTDLPIDEMGIVSETIQTGEACSRPSRAGEPAPVGLDFVPLPADRASLAVPVRIGGRVVAVVYADDVATDQWTVPAAWPEAIEILVRHASQCLEALTALKASRSSPYRTPVRSANPPSGNPTVPYTGSHHASAFTGGDDEAKRYAQLLIGDISRYNDAAVQTGRQQRDLLDRLRPQIDQARRLYENQVPATVTARRLYFDQEVLRALANGDPTLLG